MINPITLLTRRPTILSSVSFSFLFLSFSALSFGRGTGPASFSNGRKSLQILKYMGVVHVHIIMRNIQDSTAWEKEGFMNEQYRLYSMTKN